LEISVQESLHVKIKKEVYINLCQLLWNITENIKLYILNNKMSLF
jgi:hypothetical protein